MEVSLCMITLKATLYFSKLGYQCESRLLQHNSSYKRWRWFVYNIICLCVVLCVTILITEKLIFHNIIHDNIMYINIICTTVKPLNSVHPRTVDQNTNCVRYLKVSLYNIDIIMCVQYALGSCFLKGLIIIYTCILTFGFKNLPLK